MRWGPTELKCKKDLYNDTYQANVFVAGRTYEVLDVNGLSGWYLRNEQGLKAGPFVDPDRPPYYCLTDYFEW